MKCHEILGIKENSTIHEIENAYLNKMDILLEYQSDLNDSAYSLKAEEIATAYYDCLAWCDKSTSEKIRSKLTQNITNQSKQVRLYEIGFCSALGGECENECCDGCGCEGCGTAVDGLIYVAIGIGVLSGVIMLGSKIYNSHVEAKAEEERRKRQRNYNQAVNDNDSLGREQRNINDKMNREKSELDRLKQQQSEIVSFAKFSEALGAKDTTRIQQNISKKVHEKKQSVDNMQRQESEIRSKIDKNDEIIRRGQ